MTGAYVPLYIMTATRIMRIQLLSLRSITTLDMIRIMLSSSSRAWFHLLITWKVVYGEHRQPCYVPNGNGGWFLSLMAAGLDKDMEEKGVEYVNVFAVDNILQRIADPAFIGATMLAGLSVVQRL